MEVIHIGLAFKKARVSRKITRDELADISGLHKNTIERLENAVSSSPTHVIIRVSRALNMNLSDIVRFAEKAAGE